MRAILEEEHGGPEVLAVSDQPVPTPSWGQVLLKVVAAGVNRADCVQRQGFYPPPPGASSIYGLEVAGVVEALGPGLDESYLGQERVALLAGGGYAEYVAVDLAHTLPVPAGVGLTDAAGLIEVAATVYSNLVLTLGAAESPQANAGKSLLVHGGAGGIGTHAIELGRALGLQVIATAGSDEKCELIRSLGAHAINYRTENFREVTRHLTDGRGVDYLLDMVGGPYLAENIKTLAVGGSMAVIGVQGGPKGELNLGYMIPRRLSVHATSLRSRPAAEKAQIVDAVGRLVWPLVESGQVGVHTSAVFPLEEAGAAHARLESGENTGKILLTL
ncbi:NAD(P)H-quinone oxidoreductase [Rothia nasimurium]|uniref:NAD(P)H-quinone oxidoreductase n=1 Tax=Rothia nasimurium TaxID=85336 RepID=UPI001F2730ED|nr:NAD(P)H-quinone oxidoreductase [Rothia nasimurium]